MSLEGRSGRLMDAVERRHRLLRLIGALSLLAGFLVAGYVGYDWYAQGISHEVLAVVAAALAFVGLQLLLFSMMASLLVTLHREVEWSNRG